jgi:hypothetical protein
MSEEKANELWELHNGHKENGGPSNTPEAVSCKRQGGLENESI